ncbi:MAG: HEAT repeat domain-containing protein, partial [Planctomycetota bacterium]
HGGTYRGPGDTVPPGAGGAGGGAGPSTPGPAGPGAPGPSTPGAPSPAGPSTGGVPTGAQAGGQLTTEMLQTGADLTLWTYWWEFNKDPYLQLKAAINKNMTTGAEDFFNERGKTKIKETLRPSEELIKQTVVPALLATLQSEENNDIVTGCMMALAKIGDTKSETGESEFQKAITPFLRNKVQEISETAAIALGILANDSTVQTLIDLLEDSPTGRDLVNKKEVDYRTRAYAAYGLALTGKKTPNLEVKQKIVDALFRTLDTEKTSSKDLKVSCVIALGLVPIDSATAYEPAEGGKESKDSKIPRIYRRGQIQALIEYMQDKKNHEIARAHVPTALARLCEGLEPERFEALKREIAPLLLQATTKEAKEKPEVVQSAIYALGLFGDNDADKLDKDIRKTLIDAADSRIDEQAKYFSRVALAFAGSRVGTGDEPGAGIEDVRKHFLEQIGKNTKGNIRSWNSVGAGLFGRKLSESGQHLEGIGDALRGVMADVKDPKEIGSSAIALGILGESDSKKALQDKLGTKDEEALGYICVALGMLGANEAKPQITDLVEKSKYKPALLKQTAIALGLLGDKNVVEKL